MKILGFDITRKPQNNAFEVANDVSTKRMSLSDLVKGGGRIKVSRDVFYELYIRNGDIRACIRDISKRVGVKGVYLEKNGAVYEIGTDKIAKVLKYPTFLDFKVELFKHLMIGGECFIVPVYDGFKKVVGFNFLDPRTMVKFYAKDTGEITRYEQRIPGATAIKFSLDEISYFQFEKNPNNNYEGLSILEGVIYDALTDKEATERNYMFFENGMTPDGVIMLDPDFDADELEIAKAKLKNDLQGNGNAHKMLITNTIKDIKPLSLSTKDLDWINQRKLTIDKICAAIGTPKFLLGYTDGIQRGNGDATYVQYIDGTIGTMQDYAEYIINTIYGKFIDPTLEANGVVIKLNGEKVDDRKEIEIAQRLDIERGVISIDEARKERGLAPWSKTGFTDVPLMENKIGVL